MCRSIFLLFFLLYIYYIRKKWRVKWPGIWSTCVSFLWAHEILKTDNSILTCHPHTCRERKRRRQSFESRSLYQRVTTNSIPIGVSLIISHSLFSLFFFGGILFDVVFGSTIMHSAHIYLSARSLFFFWFDSKWLPRSDNRAGGLAHYSKEKENLKFPSSN